MKTTPGVAERNELCATVIVRFRTIVITSKCFRGTHAEVIYKDVQSEGVSPEMHFQKFYTDFQTTKKF